MLELFGSGYVIDHCVSTFVKEKKIESETEIFRNYIADCIKVITENTAKSVTPGQEGNYISNRFSEIMHPTYKEEKSGDEIAADIFKRAGLKFQNREGVTT